ncbi:glutamine amidotransferase-related protein [Pseudoalteromonas denitrificans]|jgi:GMP synthase-like glutamine amidotransferase|uniref:GMP synthase-Glutamine amidotransferase n=1 Tax=Pseudoalteromonas denitrificans DSM 6059 TaxID=1123010 RepID=A0A1I1LEV1_9GAMM|nr:hypothetical protein [Pseudoalteromonas denitrificans]SFC71531.1 GMP synthase-Glutamine amidotransferase [Pseudoalteromonas denitrificans DSM 6059]
MKLGILICDHVQTHLQHEFGDYQNMFIKTIIKANTEIKKLKLSFYDVKSGQYPVDINECDAYMSTGSKYSVYENKAWIMHLLSFIKTLYIVKKPFVGICFGHQLIAHALGGLVKKSDKGWGVGVISSNVEKQKHWMKPSLNSINLVVSHQDQVVQLPNRTQVLLSSEFCPYGMIQVDNHFLGIQGHPEFSREYSKALMITRKDKIPKPVLEKGHISLNLIPNDLEVMLWLLCFCEENTKLRPQTL